MAMSTPMVSTMSIQDELRTYLEENKMKSTIVALLEAILVEKPLNPVKFMVNYLKEHFPNDLDDVIINSNKNLSEQDQIEQETEDLSDEDSDDNSDSDSDNEEEHPPLINKAKPRRRASICAEKLCPSKAHEEVKKIPKSEEEFEQIRNILFNKCVLFEHLDEVQIRNVQDAMFLVEKDEGDVIIKQGDDGDNFYVIESGYIDVFIESKEGSQLVASYSKGDSFGELAIMYNASRAATCVVTKESVKLWALDRVSFKLILMKTAISKRNQYKSFLQKIPILSEMKEHEILTIADALHEESFSPSSVIFREGEDGDRFYIIKEGTVTCTKLLRAGGSEEEVAHLTNGAYFGEIALLTNKKRQATATSTSPLECVSLDRKTFKRVMGPLEDILMRNIDTYNQFQAS